MKVVEFTPKKDPYADLPPEAVLDGAKDAGLTMCVVLGWSSEGELYAASTSADTAYFEHLLNRALKASVNDEWTDYCEE